MKSFKIVGDSHQLPFDGHFGHTSQEELTETQAVLDDAEDGFDGLFAQPFDGGAWLSTSTAAWAF